MDSLFASVLPLAVGAAISPSLIALQVLVLASKESAKLKALALTAGAAATLAVISVLAATLLRSADNRAADSSHGATYIGLHLVCAAILAGLGVRALLKKPSPGERHQSKVGAKLSAAGPGFFLGVGVVGMLTDVSSLVLFIPAMHDIVRSDVGFADKVAVYAFLFVMVLLPLILPLLLVVAMGKRADVLLAQLNGFIGKNARFINAGICFIFAVYLAVLGIKAATA